MLFSGVFTCSTIYVAISPQAALTQMFGAGVSGPLAEVIARDWAVLITLTGLLLIYGAYRPIFRPLIIIFASVGKLAFVALVLTVGRTLLDVAWTAITFDAVVSIVLLMYLFTAKGSGQSPDPDSGN